VTPSAIRFKVKYGVPAQPPKNDVKDLGTKLNKQGKIPIRTQTLTLFLVTALLSSGLGLIL
jgi:hypothetical protein